MTALAVLSAAPSAAQTVTDCDAVADLRFIAEPWEANTRSFANGAVRVVVLDTHEPKMMPIKLLVLSPPVGDDRSRQCKVIAGGTDRGFAAMDFAAHSAAQEDGVGLIFSVPITVWTTQSESIAPATLSFSLNESTGHIETRLEIAGE